MTQTLEATPFPRSCPVRWPGTPRRERMSLPTLSPRSAVAALYRLLWHKGLNDHDGHVPTRSLSSPSSEVNLVADFINLGFEVRASVKHEGWSLKAFILESSNVC